MIRSIDPSSDAFLNTINQVNARMERAQREMSTGKRVNTVSDDPDRISALLAARSSMESTDQITQNLGRVKTEVDAAEAGLQNAAKLMDRVQSLAASGLNIAATPESRAALAGEVGAILEQLGGIARTVVEGRYIFSGDSDQVAPYTIDLNATNPIGSYAGSPATRMTEHPNGSQFAVSRTAQDIFDAANGSDNVFHSVQALRAALLSNDETAIGSALQDVQSSAKYLNSQLAFYGSVQNKVADATDYGSKLKLQLETQVSNIEDADMTEAILEFQQSTTQQQSALLTRSKMPRSSLFDYLG